MRRMDDGLGFVLRYENVAWYEDGLVKILDRRIYPTKVEFVTCRSHKEVAQAIRDMVTQSAGPYTAAGMGMALAAYESRSMAKDEMWDDLKKADHRLSQARHSTTKRKSELTAG